MASILLTRILPWIFLAFGLYLLTVGTRDVVIAVSAASWPSVPGIVTRSELEFADDRRIGRSGSYRARVRYEYQVGGRRHGSSRIAVVDVGSSRREEAEVIVQNYPKGSGVTVRHHPRRPELAYLEVGFSWDLMPTLGLGFFPAALGIAFLVGARRRGIQEG